MANWERRIQVWGRTLSLHCPNCGEGRIFTGLFSMNQTCPVCGVRFERESGESVGGMYINLSIAELLTIGGFFLVNTLAHPPFVPHLIFWVVFNVAFVALFYRHARSLWIGTTYLTGGVYKDREGEEEELRA